MAEIIKKHDFIELDYTGKLTDGTIFDTTLAKVAKDNKLETEHAAFAPATVCVGEFQVLPGLDEELVGKEIGKEYTITISPEKAFGKRDIKKMRIIPLNMFKEHKMDPQPGLQIDVDGEMGTIVRLSGGRVIVNFNHPLAGKEIIYDFKINLKITDNAEKIKSYFHTTIKIPKDKIAVTVTGENAEVILPVKFPAPVAEAVSKKVAEITGLKEVAIKAVEKAEKKE